jgi:hypothetical protein
VKTLTFSDLYKNTAKHLKKDQTTTDFTITRKYLQKHITNPYKIETIINKIKTCGATCDHEILTRVKPRIHGRTLLVVTED